MNRSNAGLLDLGRSILRSLFMLILGRDATAALLRFILIAAFIAIHWVVTIVGLRFPGEIPVFWLRSFPQFTYPLLNIASTFFNPQVLMHLLPLLAGLLLGLMIAARYLSDLFELDRFEIAWRYLTGAVYGLSTPKLRINSGEKDNLDANNPIKRIGGPGVVQIHLGYAAAFENIEGVPSIYGLSSTQVEGQRTPASSETTSPRTSYALRGFERLRDVVDLRDRITRVELIHAETRDGVHVLAQDAQMVFRVFGGGQQRSLTNPYPYTEDAIRRIVYAQPVAPRGRRSPTDALKEIVRTEIRSFVSRYTIDEFLALQPYRRLEGGEIQTANAASQGGIQIPRSDLTERFHTPELHERLKEQGLEMDWVGVGTWRISDLEGDAGAGQTLIRTWRDSQRLQLINSPEYHQRQRQLVLQQRPNDLLRDWVESWQAGDLPRAYRCYELLTTIARQLHAIEGRLKEAGLDPSGMDQVRKHIESLTDPDILGGERL